jgi:choline monooxygenase
MGNYRWRAALDRLTTPPHLALTPDQARLYQRYLVFPNLLVSVLPYHMTVFRVLPLGVESCRFDYEFHVREGASPLALLRGRLTQLASARIVDEDSAILGLFQQGAQAAGRQAIPLHREEEEALEHFHRVIDRYVEQGA